jgi:hypothetical protein
VVFPCGAVLAGGDRWLVSAGIHDRWIEILEWDAAASLLAGPTVNRPLRCVHLGRRVAKGGCGPCWRKDVHGCLKGRGEVRPQNERETCELYEADG